MADTPFTEDTASTGKRKRSPGNLVDVSIPPPLRRGPSAGTPSSSLGESQEDLPLTKRPRLPPKPPAPASFLRRLDALPPGILQHIFTYVDPIGLGRLSAVSRRFHCLLTTQDVPAQNEATDNVYSILPFGNIWAISRRRYLPSMPKPMRGFSEPAMFALAFGKSCQFCHKPAKSLPPYVQSPWHAGPGPQGIRNIWSFKVRSCADCLMQRVKKDSQILLSQASHLRDGLPCIFLTQSHDYVPRKLIAESSAPIGIDLSKYCYAPDLEMLQDEWREVQALGAPAAEEWLKGLPSRAEESLIDASRFEQWELTGGLNSAIAVLFSATNAPEPQRPSTSHRQDLHLPAIASSAADPRPPLSSFLPPMPAYGPAPGLDHTQPSSAPSDVASMGSQRSTGTQKPSKSSRERARDRAYKKNDIISRCSQLNPPINLDMLERLEAFEAALQVPFALNDSSWDVLKQRLLQERHKLILQDDAKRGSKVAPIPGQFRPPQQTDEYVLAHADTPRKEKLCRIAEEYIKQKYGYGGWVTYPTAPQFAADVLVHTKKTYTDEQLRISNLQTQNGFLSLEPPDQDTLRLDDMKWVFEQTVKPRTEQIRKDLFVCPDCPVTGAVKYFAFESIIQHYASKHTSAFSIGAQKVSWKADWPENPPFDVHPESVHTPAPTITHTPTLSNKPLSVMSPGSIMTTTAPSAGWRSPDTMSLVSSTTNAYSNTGTSSRWSQAVTAPGYSMYEMHKDFLALELKRAWGSSPYMGRIPDPLRLYLAMVFANDRFGMKYSNNPSLDLFIDCISTKGELRLIRDLESLRCAECIVNSDPNSPATWTSQDLANHFKRVHLDGNPSPSKPNWVKDMVALPEPAVIKSLQEDTYLTDELKAALQDAFTTSTLKSVQTQGLFRGLHNRETSRRLSQSHHTLGVGSLPEREWEPWAMSKPAAALLQPEGGLRAPSYTHQHPSSVAATYGDRASAQDSWSTMSREYMRQRPYERAHRDRSPTSLARNMDLIEVTDNVIPPTGTPMLVPEAMTRSNTVRSYHGRGSQNVSTPAEDFLSTLDAQADIEMASVDPRNNSSLNASAPLSRANSANGPNARPSRRTSVDRVKIDDLDAQPMGTSMSDIYAPTSGPIPPTARSLRPSHLPSARVYNTTFAAEPIERGPSRIVEFDRNGEPIHDLPPTEHRDMYGRFAKQYSKPNLTGSAHQISPHLIHSPDSDLSSRARYPGPESYIERRYRPLEYLPVSEHVAERVYDPGTGRYFILQQEPLRAYYRGEDRQPRVMYDDAIRQVHYQEVDESGRPLRPRYADREPGYQDHGRLDR